jgi:antibiotic biosynthesis monooxygenase (ABM) superfamily enzyme
MESLTQPVTVVIAQRVKPGREADYEAWISGITQVSSTYPGHLGAHIIRPQPGIRPEYVVVFRFDHYEHLKTWMTSRDRQHWVAKAQPLVDAEPQIQQISGIEAWFSIPGQVLKTPPRYKMALLTWGVVYILLNLLGRTVSPLLGIFPAWLATLLQSGLMVVLMTYLVMPQITQIFSRWLYPPAGNLGRAKP